MPLDTDDPTRRTSVPTREPASLPGETMEVQSNSPREPPIPATTPTEGGIPGVVRTYVAVALVVTLVLVWAALPMLFLGLWLIGGQMFLLGLLCMVPMGLLVWAAPIALGLHEGRRRAVIGLCVHFAATAMYVPACALALHLTTRPIMFSLPSFVEVRDWAAAIVIATAFLAGLYLPPIVSAFRHWDRFT